MYSALGWILEVIYHAVTQGSIVNRGFLNGPVCPVYGFGMLSVIFIMQIRHAQTVFSLSNEPMWLSFLIGIVFATSVELFAGVLLDKLFHARWWDYSRKPFNYHGYICLEFSLIWGMAVAIVLRDIQPWFESISAIMIPSTVGWLLLALLYAVLAADAAVTVLTVLELNKQLEELDRIRRSMRVLSDEMSKVIGGGAIKTVNELARGRVRLLAEADRRKRDLESQQERILRKLTARRVLGTRRILSGIPELRHRRFDEALKWIQQQSSAGSFVGSEQKKHDGVAREQQS